MVISLGQGTEKAEYTYNKSNINLNFSKIEQIRDLNKKISNLSITFSKNFQGVIIRNNNENMIVTFSGILELAEEQALDVLIESYEYKPPTPVEEQEMQDKQTFATIDYVKNQIEGLGGRGSASFEFYHIYDEKETGTNGGNGGNKEWVVRDINKIISPNGNAIKVKNNSFNLSKGKWLIDIKSPALRSGFTTLRLFNLSKGKIEFNGQGTFLNDSLIERITEKYTLAILRPEDTWTIKHSEDINDDRVIQIFQTGNMINSSIDFSNNSNSNYDFSDENLIGILNNSLRLKKIANEKYSETLKHLWEFNFDHEDNGNVYLDEIGNSNGLVSGKDIIFSNKSNDNPLNTSYVNFDIKETEESGQRINCGNFLMPGGQMSFSCFVKVADDCPSCTLLGKTRSNSYNDYVFSFELERKGNSSNYSLLMRINNSGESVSSKTIKSGEWYFLTYVYNYEESWSERPKMYINGNLANERGGVGEGILRQDSFAPVAIGNNPAGRPQQFKGFLDQCALWTTPLNREQIRELYNEGRGSSLSGYTTEKHFWAKTNFNSRINTLQWSDIISININQNLPENTEILYMISFDKGDNWIYWNGENWVTGFLDNFEGMTAEMLENIDDYTSVFEQGTFDMAFLLRTENSNITPELNNVYISYTGGEETLVNNDLVKIERVSKTETKITNTTKINLAELETSILMTTEYNPSSLNDTYSTTLSASGIVNVESSGSQVYRVEQYTEKNNGNTTLGVAMAIRGRPEIYTNVILQKIGN